MPALETPICDFGWTPPAFELPDTDGQLYSLQQCRGRTGTVVAFICNHCPYVKAIAAKLVRDADALRDIGMSFVAICSNDAADHPEDGFERMGEFARAHGFPFPYLHDETQEVARAWGAVCTPDFFGFDATLGLQYRGRLDAAGARADVDAPSELLAAMQEVVRTGRGPARQTPSIGCSIKWRRAGGLSAGSPVRGSA